MNPNPKALVQALCLLGETESSVAEEYLFKRQPEFPSYADPFKPRSGEAGYKPGYFSEWVSEQKQQDLLLLQEFVWEYLFAENLKAQRIEQQHPELLDNPEFLAYQQTVKHAIEVISGRLVFVPNRGAIRTYAEPDLAGHRIGFWPEEDAQ